MPAMPRQASTCRLTKRVFSGALWWGASDEWGGGCSFGGPAQASNDLKPWVGLSFRRAGASLLGRGCCDGSGGGCAGCDACRGCLKVQEVVLSGPQGDHTRGVELAAKHQRERPDTSGQIDLLGLLRRDLQRDGLDHLWLALVARQILGHGQDLYALQEDLGDRKS